jgi:type VI secretion system protein ImpG
MSDELLPYYNRELSFIRQHAAEFAKAHPKIAGRLQLGADAANDPHVERLIEAFAYLSARIRHKLDDDFPEIAEAMLEVLYPHYRAPIPSSSIVQFELDPRQNKLGSGLTIPRHTGIETEPVQGEPCRFRTCYPVDLWPIEVRSARLERAPFVAPSVASAAGASAVLRLVLGCRAKEMSFAALDLKSLRFFLKGQAQHVFRLYELIFNNAIAVALAGAPGDPAPAVLEPECLRPVGFDRDEGVLPYSARSFPGYRLLSEYFAFAEKFLFVDLHGLDQRALGRVGNQLEVFLYLNRTAADLEQNIGADSFRLGCTPIVNLYRQRADPIRLTHNDVEYRVVPDARRPLGHEVYSIDRVVATSPAGEEREFLPFFSVRHAAEARSAETFWYATRRPTGSPTDHGHEAYLSLVDLGFQPSAPADWTLDVETTCLNRDLPHRLPFGGDQPRLQLSEGGALIARIICLTPPTRTRRPALRHGTLWSLISHLALNHLSLVDVGGSADALREILKLYDFADSPETRSMIDGILSVTSRRVVGRVRDEGGAGPRGVAAFCRGVEVAVQFDEGRFSGSGVYLFASVLERFLALYCTLNSFTRFHATVKGREGALRRWPPRMGERVLA